MFPSFPRSPSPMTLTRARPAAFALGLCLALVSVDCSRFTRTRQCRALIAQVNPALDEVLALTDAGAGGSAGGANGTDSARYVSAAARYERLAKDLGPMEFSSEQMAKYVAEYASGLAASAQALRALASAQSANNGAEVERQNRELEHLALRERSSISRMDAWCQSD
jgi:hypothetical protein